MKNLFHNNYAMAVISIILIVLIVAVTLNFNTLADDSAGQAYLQETQEGVIRVESSPSMTKIYIESEPERYAYLRDK